MIQEIIGQRIKYYRQEQGLSQEQFALSIGMDRTYISSVEAGRRNISIHSLDKIIHGLSISYSDLFKDL